MVKVFRVRAFACDDPALQLMQPRWQEFNQATIRECIRLSENPTVEAALKMPIDLIFSRRVNVSKPGAKLSDTVSDSVNSWVDEIRKIMYDLDTFGVAIAVIGIDKQPAAVWMNSVKLQFYYTQDQMLTFRLILPKTMEEMGTVSASNPTYGNIFTTRDSGLRSNRLWKRNQHRKKRTHEESSSSSPRGEFDNDPGDSESESDDDANQKEYTERERVDRARFYLFMCRKPNPDESSGGVNSKVKTIALTASMAKSVTDAALVAATDSARVTAAVETTERKIDNSDPNLDTDFAMPGDRRLAHEADIDNASHAQHIRVMEQSAVAESMYNQTTAQMGMSDVAAEHEDIDPVSKMATRPNIRIRVGPAVRLLYLPAGSKLAAIPPAQIPEKMLEASLSAFSTDVSNMSGVPASLMAADGSKTNMNVTEAQWNRFWVTCLERDQIARVIVETFFHDIYGEQTYSHAVMEAGRAHALRQVQHVLKKGIPEEEMSQFIDKQVLNMQKLHMFVNTVLNRKGMDAIRTDTRKHRGGKSAKRQRLSETKTGGPEGVTSLGIDARPVSEGADGQTGDKRGEGHPADGGEDEGDDDDEYLPNIDDFEPFKDDSFHLDVAKFKKITVSFLGSLDPFVLISYEQMGLIKFGAVKEFVLKGIHNIPDEFIPDEPLDPTTGIPAAEMYMSERQAQERQFDEALEVKAQGGGEGGGVSGKGLGGGAHPSSSSGRGPVFGQNAKFGSRPKRFDTRVTHSLVDDQAGKGKGSSKK